MSARPRSVTHGEVIVYNTKNGVHSEAENCSAKYSAVRSKIDEEMENLKGVLKTRDEMRDEYGSLHQDLLRISVEERLVHTHLNWSIWMPTLTEYGTVKVLKYDQSVQRSSRSKFLSHNKRVKAFVEKGAPDSILPLSEVDLLHGREISIWDDDSLLRQEISHATEDESLSGPSYALAGDHPTCTRAVPRTDHANALEVEFMEVDSESRMQVEDLQCAHEDDEVPRHKLQMHGSVDGCASSQRLVVDVDASYIARGRTVQDNVASLLNILAVNNCSWTTEQLEMMRPELEPRVRAILYHCKCRRSESKKIVTDLRKALQTQRIELKTVRVRDKSKRAGRATIYSLQYSPTS